MKIPLEFLTQRQTVFFQSGAELLERERHHGQFYITPGQQRGQLPGQKIPVGTGEVKVAILLQKRLSTAFW